MTRDEILALFRATDALLEGHFQLTSGLHSPQYFQCAKVLQYPPYAEILCGEIASHFRHEDLDVVIAPAIGGIIVGQEVARLLSREKPDQPLRSLFTERKDNVMALRRGFGIRAGERVLVCEDVVTTGGSVKEVIELVKNKGGSIGGVGYIVDRSGGKAQFAVPSASQFAVLKMDVVTYQPEACPLCRERIPIEKPGSRPIR